MMPALDGMALIRGARETMPDLKIIASSGLGTDMGGSFRAQELRSLGVMNFLPKPYATDKLLQMLHQMMGKSPGAKPAWQLAV
jgi:CheY-like chemotaxis protein